MLVKVKYLLVLVNMMIPVLALADFLPGYGTEDDPYRIENLKHFKLFYHEDNAGLYWSQGVYINLNANINLSGKTYDRALIGADESNTFEGIFNGNGHFIKSFKIKSDGIAGLFGVIGDSGAVSNLEVRSASIRGAGESIGGLAGINKGTITKCNFKGDVSGKGDCGGLVGHNSADSSDLDSAVISKCYCEATVIGSGTNVGGLAGYNYGTISNSYSESKVRGISDDSGSSTNNIYTGGFVASNNGIISDSYSVGSVSGLEYYGGFAGQSLGTGLDESGNINNCYTSCRVFDKRDAAGFVAQLYGDLAIENCFWNYDDAKLSQDRDSSDAVALSKSQMESKNTFQDAGWLFAEGDYTSGSPWEIVDGEFPYLWAVGDNEISSQAIAGAGTEEDPYIISTVEQFIDFADTNNSDKYWSEGVYTELHNNINLSGKSFTAAVIASNDGEADDYYGVGYSGNFDGRFHTITGLKIDTGGVESHSIGLFGRITEQGIVSNLELKNVNVNSTNTIETGAVCGSNYGLINSCTVSGTIEGKEDTGAICGTNFGTVSNSSSNCRVAGSMYVGGLIGTSNSIEPDDPNSVPVPNAVSNCYSSGVINCGENSKYIGGICGKSYYTLMSVCNSDVYIKTDDGASYVGGVTGESYSVTFISCYFTAQILLADGCGNIGGFSGSSPDSAFSWCYADASITAGDNNDKIGGFDNVGSNSSYDNCYSFGKIRLGDNSSYIGGFAGDTQEGQYQDCYSNVNIITRDNAGFIGGFIGSCDTVILNCNASGSIKVGDSSCRVGGFLGLGDEVENSFSTGDVTAGTNSEYIGGFCGDGEDLVQCYSTGNVKLLGSEAVYIGGFVGSGSAVRSYAEGTVKVGKGSQYIGGFCGQNSNSIDDCYSLGAVISGSESQYIGGFIGESDGSEVTNCFSAGNIKFGKDSLDVGGFCGSDSSGDSVINCFWDVDVSKVDSSAGGSGLTTKEMQDRYSYIDAGWEFVEGEYFDETWFMVHGYPLFTWKDYEDVDDEYSFTLDSVQIRSGKDRLEPKDSISFRASGFDVPLQALVDNFDLTIRSYDDPNNEVYYETLIFDDFNNNRCIIKNEYSSFVFDLNKQTFNYTGKNIDLSGLYAPLEVSLENEFYSITAIAYDVSGSDDVINGGRSIPIDLMMGISDTLTVEKTVFKPGNRFSSDSLLVQGEITVEDADIDIANIEVVISCGDYVVAIPAGKAEKLDKKNVYRYKYPKGSTSDAVTMLIDLDKCMFIISIKNADLRSLGETYDFGLQFGSFDQAQTITQ